MLLFALGPGKDPWGFPWAATPGDGPENVSETAYASPHQSEGDRLLTVITPNMRRSYQRRSSEERVAQLESKIAELKAKRTAREKKSDPILREIHKLQKHLKRFIQLAHDNSRPDIANSAMGFRSMLERTVVAEQGSRGPSRGEEDDG